MHTLDSRIRQPRQFSLASWWSGFSAADPTRGRTGWCSMRGISSTPSFRNTIRIRMSRQIFLVARAAISQSATRNLVLRCHPRNTSCRTTLIPGYSPCVQFDAAECSSIECPGTTNAYGEVLCYALSCPFDDSPAVDASHGLPCTHQSTEGEATSVTYNFLWVASCSDCP